MIKPSLIYLAAASAGPVMVDVLGHPVPVLSASLSVLGVVLASVIAPPPALSMAKRVALTALLVVLIFALAISDPSRSPILATCWGIGIGYSGLPIIQAISERIFARAPGIASATAEASLNDHSEDNKS